ncbi:MAG TPA: hypothetical protein VJ508_00780, partial [Saprospiraceae bacterium]|nr:hypothetical protein [Saprospiraceae bacterium]
DNCDLSATVTYSDVTVGGGCPQEYTITRTWQAIDDCSNSSTCVQVITIDDSMSPAITCPANVTLECTANTLPPNTGSATATDNCDATPEVTYTDVTTGGPCPQQYTITRTWKAQDDCSNSSTCVQTIFIHDTTDPVITCPADITIQCIDNTLPPNTGSATATDNCDTAPDLDYIDVTMLIPGTDGYKIQRTWTTIDACGNDATCTQTIIVTNPLNPEITGSPFDTICSGNTVTFLAMDQGIQPITYQWSFGSGSSPSSATGIGPHTVTYTYNATNGTIGAFVVLTVTTPGCPSATDTVANVHVNPLPDASITATGSNCIFTPKMFHPTQPVNNSFTYLWNFGSGAVPATGTGWGPHTVEYGTSGSKTVQLIVYTNAPGASCGDTSTITFTINTCPGQITGRVFLPTNTTDTTGILNVNVRLFADNNLDGIADNTTIIKNVFTNSLGRYSMASVTPGYYVIQETQPANFFSLWD